MRATQPKLADLRELYREAVVWGLSQRVNAARKIIQWYDTKSAFKPITVDKKFDKLRELAVNNPAPHEALTAAERIIPIYEQQLLSGVDKAPQWKRVIEEIKTREAELKAAHEAAEETRRIELEAVASVASTLNTCYDGFGLRFAVRHQEKVRMYENGTLYFSVTAAKEMQAGGSLRTVLSTVDTIARALSYDQDKASISAAEYCKLTPKLLAAAEAHLSNSVTNDGKFTYLKRAKSDKAALVGERYRPYTYQAIVWQRLYEAQNEWVLKTELTAGLDTPWPHRIWGHLQKDGVRGGRWQIDIEAKRVRMVNVTVKPNIPDMKESAQ